MKKKEFCAIFFFLILLPCLALSAIGNKFQILFRRRNDQDEDVIISTADIEVLRLTARQTFINYYFMAFSQLIGLLVNNRKSTY